MTGADVSVRAGGGTHSTGKGGRTDVGVGALAAPARRPATGYVLRDTCLRCGGGLVDWHHWRLCPRCEPDFCAELFPPLPAPALLGVGRPTRNGRVT